MSHSDLAVGFWVKRGTGKWHLTESVVAGDSVTRCGKTMSYELNGRKLEMSMGMPLTRMIGQPQLCKAGCDS